MDERTRAEKDSDIADAAGVPVPKFTPDLEPAGPLGLVRRFELSPINARRWQNFKANRRGYWSLWLFLFLFIVTLFAEFIANDKPLYLRYDGKSYFPVFFTYPETTFGGDFETAADYRDPYLKKIIAEKGGTILRQLRAIGAS